jgi:glycopeptide antibiotics resistance protein
MGGLIAALIAIVYLIVIIFLITLAYRFVVAMEKISDSVNKIAEK